MISTARPAAGLAGLLHRSRLLFATLLLLGFLADVALAREARLAWIDLEGALEFGVDEGQSVPAAPSDDPSMANDGLQRVAFGGRAWPVAAGESDLLQWPLWSPDGARVLVLGQSREGHPTGPVQSLEVIEAATGRSVARIAKPLLFPIYAHWSPRGDRLLVLTQLGPALGIWTWNLSPSPASELEPVAAGPMPVYFDWSRDGRRVALLRGVEGGGVLSVMDLGSNRASRVTDRPGDFGAPSWSADGTSLEYGELSDELTTLVVARGEDARPESTGVTARRVAAAWAPRGDVLAVAHGQSPDPLPFDALEVLRRDGAGTWHRRTLVQDQVAAFFWSPTGEHLAYARAEEQPHLWSWRVVEVASGESRDVATFVPSRPYGKLFRYFDQYALSHHVWSPDGTRLVYAGMGPGRHGERVPPRIWVAPIDGSTPPRAVAEGTVAFWAPK